MPEEFDLLLKDAPLKKDNITIMFMKRSKNIKLTRRAF